MKSNRSTFQGFVLSSMTFVFLLCLTAHAQPFHEHLLYSHPLTSLQNDQGMILKNTDGVFTAQGWQSTQTTSQLFITLPKGLPFEGTLSVKVTNFDPFNQNIATKQPIIDLYSNPCGNKEIYETDGAWFHLISGTNYVSGKPNEAGFKLWAASKGVGSKEEDRLMHDAIWDPRHTYEFKFIWSGSKLYFLVDGVEEVQLPFSGQVEKFRYIFLGKDNLMWGYMAQPGPIFSDLRILTSGENNQIPIGPKLTAVSAITQDRVEVLFNEPVESISAVQLDHYEIIPAVKIFKAEHSDNPGKIYLTTAPHRDGTNYTLKIYSIGDTGVPSAVTTVDSMNYRYEEVPVSAISLPKYRLHASRSPGDSVYCDRNFTFVQIPERFSSFYWIITANDDKGASLANFLQFYAKKRIKLIVGIDLNGKPAPTWTSDWTPLSERIITTDSEFKLYEKEFDPGTVTLSGNGMDASSSMYLVLLQPLATTEVDLPPAAPTGVKVIVKY